MRCGLWTFKLLKFVKPVGSVDSLDNIVQYEMNMRLWRQGVECYYLR